MRMGRGAELALAAVLAIGGAVGGCGSNDDDDDAAQGGSGGQAATTGGASGGIASTGGLPPDSGSGGRTLDGGDATDAAGGRPVPGPECIAPCIWELMEPCRPTGPCVRTIEETTARHCYADGVTEVSSAEHRYYYMPDGSPCYSVDFTGGAQVWHDGSGATIATLTSDDVDGSQTVVCGGNEYHVDVNTPECQAALDAPECEMGECTAGL